MGDDQAQLEPGYRLDRYELLCPIAHGGMASVWLARLHGKHGFEKLVAIKTILPQYAADPRFQRMFLEEARIAAGIEHPNVAQILDLGETHDVLYLVMEWIDGDSLSKLHRAVDRRKQRIPLGIVLRVLADTCAALHAAHEMRDKFGVPLGVVHRDVSPQNILVSARGTSKLIDFGIAKARDRATGDTNTGLLKGKIQYMAPEQAMGKAIDRRADVWAIGAVLYYVLAGVPPYDGANQLASLHMLTSGDPPPPLPSRYAPEVNALCMAALTFEADARIPSAEAMRHALERLMRETGTHTTESDVGAFVAEHLADRTATRRKAVDLALSASAERRRVSILLEPPSDPSASGLAEEGSISLLSMSAVPEPDAERPSLHPPLPPPRLPPKPAAEPEPSAIAMLDAWRAQVDPLPLPPLGEPEVPISQITSATLGSAVLATPSPSSAIGSGAKTMWAAIVGAVSIVGLVVAITALLRMPESSRGAVSPDVPDEIPSPIVSTLPEPPPPAADVPAPAEPETVAEAPAASPELLPETTETTAEARKPAAARPTPPARSPALSPRPAANKPTPLKPPEKGAAANDDKARFGF